MKSKIIKLVLITAALAGCSGNEPRPNKRVHMRADSTGSYQRSSMPMGFWWLYRPYGIWSPSTGYTSLGYQNNRLNPKSNFGSSQVKRGGFGNTTRMVSG